MNTKTKVFMFHFEAEDHFCSAVTKETDPWF